ncbi:hypothetical protein CapIbe_017290 [Capra ibex]
MHLSNLLICCCCCSGETVAGQLSLLRDDEGKCTESTSRRAGSERETLSFFIQHLSRLDWFYVWNLTQSLWTGHVFGAETQFLCKSCGSR